MQRALSSRLPFFLAALPSPGTRADFSLCFRSSAEDYQSRGDSFDHSKTKHENKHLPDMGRKSFRSCQLHVKKAVSCS